MKLDNSLELCFSTRLSFYYWKKSTFSVSAFCLLAKNLYMQSAKVILLFLCFFFKLLKLSHNETIYTKCLFLQEDNRG